MMDAQQAERVATATVTAGGQAATSGDGAADSAMAAALAARCFLCGRPAYHEVWRENGHRALACACGLAFVAPPPVGVDATRDAHAAAFYRLPARAKVAWLLRHRGGGRLLEVGCGEGWFLAAARRAGYDARGLDADAARVATARRRGFDVRHGLFEETRIDERFDVVFHCDLLSHFPEPIAALRRMSALLRPGGLLYFEVGILGAPLRAWYPRIGGIGLPQHRWLYSERALELLFARARLRVVATRRFGLGPAVWLSQAVRGVAGTARPLVQRARAALASVEARLVEVERVPAWVEQFNEACAQAGATVDRDRDTAPPPPWWRAALRSAGEHADHFARYGVGAWTPRLGPGTLLVLAAPTEQP